MSGPVDITPDDRAVAKRATAIVVESYKGLSSVDVALVQQVVDGALINEVNTDQPAAQLCEALGPMLREELGEAAGAACAEAMMLAFARGVRAGVIAARAALDPSPEVEALIARNVL
jgi:hypothetical protein